MRISRVWKAVIAAVGTLVTLLTAAVADDVFNVDESVAVGVALVEAAVTVWGVYKARNEPQVSK